MTLIKQDYQLSWKIKYTGEQIIKFPRQVYTSGKGDLEADIAKESLKVTLDCSSGV